LRFVVLPRIVVGRFKGSTIGIACRSGQIPLKREEYAGTQRKSAGAADHPNLKTYGTHRQIPEIHAKVSILSIMSPTSCGLQVRTAE